MTQVGQLLEITSFLYVDYKIQEDGPDLKTLYDSLCIQEHATFESDCNTAQILDPFDPSTMQDQGNKQRLWYMTLLF